MEEKNLPEERFSTGAISATIWKNEGTSKNGQPVTFRTITLQRRYKDKDDEWKTSHSLRVNDVPKAALVLNKAYEYLVLRSKETQEPEGEIKEEFLEEEVVM